MKVITKFSSIILKARFVSPIDSTFVIDRTFREGKELIETRILSLVWIGKKVSVESFVVACFVVNQFQFMNVYDLSDFYSILCSAWIINSPIWLLLPSKDNIPALSLIFLIPQMTFNIIFFNISTLVTIHAEFTTFYASMLCYWCRLKTSSINNICQFIVFFSLTLISYISQFSSLEISHHFFVIINLIPHFFSQFGS